MNRPTIVVHYILCVLFFASNLQLSNAQEYDLITNTEVYWPLQPMSKPNYLETIVDVVYNTKITRITGDVGSPIPNTNESWRNVARHGYSVRQPWNSDESVIYLGQNKTYNGGWGSSLFLDGQTYEVLGKANIPSSNEIRWHPSDPNLMYLLNNTSIKTWNHITGEQITLINFSGYSNVSLGSYTGNFSKDGTMAAILATRNSDSKTVTFAVNVDEGVKYEDIDLNDTNVDFVTISPLGNYIVVNANFGSGFDRTKIYDLEGNQVGPFWSEYGRPSHFDVAIDQNGDEVAVGVSKSNPDDGRVIKRRMSDGQVTVLTPGGYASHSSARSLDRSGWVYTHTSDSPNWLPYQDELIAVKLDGTRVERICNSRAVWQVYDNQPQACPSPSGGRVIFASDWGEDGLPIQGYIVDFRDKLINQNGSANAGQDQNICDGQIATLNASGGDTYLWSTGETTQSIVVSPNSTTTYTVTAFVGNESDTDDVIVHVNASPNANAGNDVSILDGESTTLSASGGDTFIWSTGETTQSISVTPNTTTTYSVTAFLNDCEDSDDVLVTVVSEVIADAGEDVTICQNSSTTLTATGGTNYLWSTGETTQSIIVSPNVTTTYSVTVSSGNSSDADDVMVIVNPNPTANAGSDVTISEGENTTLTASGGESYVWSTGETTQSISVSPNSTTTYTVIAILNGCEDTDDVVVIVETEQVVADAGADVDICQGDSVTLTANGGTDYLWSTGETTQSITVNPNSTTIYTVIVSNETSSDTDDVTVEVNPTPNVSVTGDTTILEGDYITLSASGANNYEWSNGATQPNIAVSPNVTTTYVVTGYINNCYDVKDVTVSVVEQVIVDAGNDTLICLGDDITLTANASGAEDYLWNTGETTQSITVSPNTNTMYTVIASNSMDSQADNIMVSVNVCEEEETAPEDDEFAFIAYIDSRVSDDILNVKLLGLEDQCALYLFDISGKLIHTDKFNGYEGQEIIRSINTSKISDGVYIIKVEDANNVHSKSIVIR